MQDGEQRTHKKRRRKTVHKAAPRPAEQRRPSLAGFRIGGPAGNDDGDERFRNPCKQPGERRSLARRDGGCSEGGNAHGHATPTGNRGKGSGALHGFADETKVVAGMVGNGDGSRSLAGRMIGERHTTRVAGGPLVSSTLFCKVP